MYKGREGWPLNAEKAAGEGQPAGSGIGTLPLSIWPSCRAEIFERELPTAGSPGSATHFARGKNRRPNKRDFS
ncbi:MAG: hypothetical protein LBU32_12005 [Clostridiales bacterium]|nr:hypothetical protein [Clostridiales bacterium]